MLPKNANIFLYADKKKSSQFNGIIGLLPNNKTTGKLLLSGDVHLKLLNSFYRGELIDFNFPLFTINAHVSHGTYIRSLICDIARKAGGCATTSALQRTKIGPYKIEQAVDLEKLQTADDIRRYCISVDQFFDKSDRSWKVFLICYEM